MMILFSAGDFGHSAVHEIFFNHPVRVCQDIMVPETENDKTLCMQPCIAFFFLRFPIRMMPAVHVNRRLFFKTDRIDDIRPGRMLPPDIR